MNTLLRLPKGNLNPKTFEVSSVYTVEKDNERFFPLHCAILLEGTDDIFYGYCVAESAELKGKKTTVTFRVLSLFSKEEREIYTNRFNEAAKLTGEMS